MSFDVRGSLAPYKTQSCDPVPELVAISSTVQLPEFCKTTERSSEAAATVHAA